MSARKNRNKKLMKSRKLIHEYQRMEAEVKQLKAKRERERERERIEYENRNLEEVKDLLTKQG